MQNVTFIKNNQQFIECYKDLERINLGIHKEEDQTHSVMMMIMKNHPHLLIILVQPDITVWKLFVHHVVL